VVVDHVVHAVAVTQVTPVHPADFSISAVMLQILGAFPFFSDFRTCCTSASVRGPRSLELSALALVASCRIYFDGGAGGRFKRFE